MSDGMSHIAEPAQGAGGGLARRRLVGRDVVLKELLDLIASADERAVGVAVMGEPGTGKTALLTAASFLVKGFDVLRASGIEVEAELPFAGLHQLLGPVLSSLAAISPRQREVLESALAIGSVVAHDELAVGAAVLGVLGAAAEQRPLLIVLDDSQWIDRGSFDAVLFAFRRLRDQPIALVIGSRTGQAAPALSADFREITLRPLDPVSARALVIDYAPRGLDGADVDRITELGGGLPLALVELARSAGMGDAPSFGANPHGSVEQIVARLFGERIGNLSSGAAAVTLVAALDDPSEQDAFVRAGELLGASESDWVQSEVAAIIRASTGRIDFVHPLLREAVVRRASPQALRRAHQALAEALDARGDHDRALIHRAAGTLGADESLAAALERSAENHRERAGHPAAARALVQAARLSATSDERARRLLLAADAARRGGESRLAESLAVEARRGSPDDLLRARAELIQAHIEARRGSTEAALRRYERVADQASDGAPDLAALALTYASSAAAVIGDVRGALQTALRAERIDNHHLSAETVIAVRESVGSALALSGATAKARALLEQAAGWYEEQEQRVGAEYVAEALTWLGDFGRARQLLDDVAADARRLAAPGLLIQALELRADLGYRSGTWSGALADASEAVSLAQDADQTVLLAYSRAILAILQAATGAEESARVTANEARHGARQHGLRVVEESASFALAAVELAVGNPQRALAELEPTAAAAAASGRGEPAMCLWPAELIEALIAVDRRQDAQTALDDLEARAVNTGGDWTGGVVARYRGVLAEEAQFDALFEEAIARHAGSRMPFELARTKLCYGQRLRRAGRRVDARHQIRDALATFEGLRAKVWVTRAERELASSGERLRRAAAFDRDELTPQELQVARLVSAGATNQEAAAELFLSPKTIETHLTRIYRKLGVRSRSQLARHVPTDGPSA
jgi:DNA-binding CsgD family transcriptional regulator